MEEIGITNRLPLFFMVEQEFQRKISKKRFLLEHAKINVNTENQIDVHKSCS